MRMQNTKYVIGNVNGNGALTYAKFLRIPSDYVQSPPESTMYSMVWLV